MALYEDADIVVRPSPIEGLGVFAKRAFKKGELVLKWNPTPLSENGRQSLPEDQKRYLNTLEDGTTVLMNIPERYINHSDNPNTRPEGKSDIALRDINAAEEITSSYKF